jgi:hypothetical protein
LPVIHYLIRSTAKLSGLESTNKPCPYSREKLGPYEILASIGAGGMGEVWKAHDTRLGRDMAIKVSAQQFTERFEREPRAMVRQGFNRAFTETWNAPRRGSLEG